MAEWNMGDVWLPANGKQVLVAIATMTDTGTRYTYHIGHFDVGKGIWRLEECLDVIEVHAWSFISSPPPF